MTGLRGNTEFILKSHELRPIAPTIALWDGLRQRGIKQGIVSNADHMLLEANLKAPGRLRPRDITLSRNDVLRGKPEPEPYLRAAYLAGVNPENCLVLEDSLPGARAGLAAGMKTCLAPHAPKKDLEGARVLSSYSEVYELL
ncbi:MAG: HAD family phosphatase [Rhodobacteraceae bacterium]|nr:HAD family phosphatase [Paracoccaceae bacterium]